MDTTALETFVGACNDSFVVKWYDQSGNGLDISQTTDGSQPLIVESGSVTENQLNKPAVKFDGVDNVLVSSADLSSPPDNVFEFMVNQSGTTNNGNKLEPLT